MLGLMRRDCLTHLVAIEMSFLLALWALNCQRMISAQVGEEFVEITGDGRRTTSKVTAFHASRSGSS